MPKGSALLFFEVVPSSTEFRICLLLFSALAEYLLAAQINQPAVVGIAVRLVTTTPFVQSPAHLGAGFLLFVIGFRLLDLLPRNQAIAQVGEIRRQV